MKIVLGSYATPPRPLQSAAEFALLSEATLGIPEVSGLELPFVGADSPWQDVHGLAGLGGRHVLTTLPATTAAVARDPSFGLASPDAEARSAAIELIAAAREFVARVNDGPGARIGTVHLHSAPGGGRATRDAFARSLDVVAGWEWGAVVLAVEHCDAFTPAHAAEKGYLPLPDELALASDRGLGTAINWGRSAIEARGADGAVEHVVAAAEAGTLVGLVFSGCSAVDGAYGPAWADKHLPVREWGTGPLSDAAHDSILTRAEVERCRRAAATAPRLDYVGVKVKAPQETEPEQWLDVLRGNVAAVAELVGHGRQEAEPVR